MPTQGSIEQVCINSFDLLEEDICMLQSKVMAVLLGDFKVMIGESDYGDDVTGMIGETIRNSNGNLLITSLQN